MKKFLKFLFFVFVFVLAAALLYVAYVFIDYHRIEDNLSLAVENVNETEMQTAHEYKILTYNIGFGAYESDYGFFMDGGTESHAWSMQRLDKNLTSVSQLIASQNADFYLIQEVDIDADRTYHFDETVFLKAGLPSYNSVFAVNYDSPYLFYPFTKPIGKSKSGIMSFSAFKIESSLRCSLPVEKGFSKILDLDRCYTKSRIKVENGKELVLYNLHLSAYTSDGTVTLQQLQLLIEDMQEEYEKGAWCLAGGDFNKDIAGVGSLPFIGIDKTYNWSQALPESVFENTDIVKVVAFDEENPVASCRNADGPYTASQYQIIIDGFLVSKNVEVLSSEIIDTQFAYSDHNPVVMSFLLN